MNRDDGIACITDNNSQKIIILNLFEFIFDELWAENDRALGPRVMEPVSKGAESL